MRFNVQLLQRATCGYRPLFQVWDRFVSEVYMQAAEIVTTCHYLWLR